MILDRLEEYPDSQCIPGAKLVSGLEWSACPELRRAGLGASEVSAAIGVDDYRGTLQLWKVKTGQESADDLSEVVAIRHGHLGEPYLLSHAERLGCPEPREHQLLVTSADRPWLHATLDAITSDRIPIEAKTASPQNPWATLMADAVASGRADAHLLLPERYTIQVQVQMALCDADQAYVLVCVWGRAEFCVLVPRDNALLDRVWGHLDRFWEHVQSGTPPRPSGADLDLMRLLRPQAGRITNLSAISARDADDLARAEMAIASCDLEIDLRVRDLKRQRATAERQAKAARARLYQAIGDAEIGVLPDGRRIEAPWRTRKSYEVKAKESRPLFVKGGRRA